MRMKREFYLPLLITLLASLVFGVLPVGQPAKVYAAPDYEYKKPQNFSDPNNEWNAELQAYDLTPDDQTTAADSTARPGNTDPWITFDTWEAKVETYTATTLFVNWKTDGLFTNDEFAIRFTKDGGTNWGDLVAMGVHNDTTIVPSSIALDVDQDLTLVQVKLAYSKVQQSDAAGIIYIYDIWTRGTYTPAVPPDISNSPNTWAFGTVSTGSSYETGITYVVDSTGFRITNNVAFDVNITISATDMGIGWLLADSGDPDATHYTLWAGTELTGGLYNIQVTSVGVSLITVLASSTRDWGLKLMTPTSFSDGGLKSGTVTLTATQA